MSRNSQRTVRLGRRTNLGLNFIRGVERERETEEEERELRVLTPYESKSFLRGPL